MNLLISVLTWSQSTGKFRREKMSVLAVCGAPTLLYLFLLRGDQKKLFTVISAKSMSLDLLLDLLIFIGKRR